MTDTLGQHSIWGRMITNLQFVDDTVGLASKEKELNSLVQHLDRTSTAYETKIKFEETKLMTNKSEGIKRYIEVNGQRLEMANSFKYFGTVVTDEGTKTEVQSRIVQASAALKRLRITLRDKKILSNPISDWCTHS